MVKFDNDKLHSDQYEEAYEAAMEPTNSFNWEPGLFVRGKRGSPAATTTVVEDIYCWRCNRMLNEHEFYYCFDCLEECWSCWGC